MKILFLAPEPFFQERGTPIAVRLALEVLTDRISRRQNTGNRSDSIDLITYNEGEDIAIPGVRILRIPTPKFLRGVGPGISIKKLMCDVVFTIYVFQHVLRSGGARRYNLVHAVEESVFVALILKLFFGLPYIYDMDSSLALQVSEKWWVLRPLRPMLSLIEKLAVKYSEAVVPVCDALAVVAKQHGSKYTSVLSDVSLLKGEGTAQKADLRLELGVSPETPLVVYIGNLERYQGIDLLIESFGLVSAQEQSSRLVIIGGRPEHIKHYESKAASIGISHRVHLAGPRPVEKLDDYIYNADILVSPRTKGNNTPMKIYSYLHSGRAMVATRLPTHTQVLDDEVCALADPTSESFGGAILRLITDHEERSRLGRNARALAEERYTFDVFKDRLNMIYDQLDASLELRETANQASRAA
ncbi:MAG: glycosyltransferase [Oligoflexia bacterium]|nr:glycosyltransferase [Oligoflexia bacterium]